MDRMVIQGLIGFTGVILLILMVAWVEQQLLGYADIRDTITWTMLVQPFTTFITNVVQGLSSPFTGLAIYFEQILPPAMAQYAWVAAVVFTGTIVLGIVIIMLRLTRVRH